MIALSKVFGIAILSILLVGFGVAMAMWSETLRINTYVNTGIVKVKWSDWECSDTGADPQAEGFNNTEGKDVAKCVVEPEILDEENNTIKLKINITNAYPGYKAEITLVVDNIGTIPVKLYKVNWTDVDSEDLSDLLVTFTGPEDGDIQIEPEENDTYKLTIIVNQDADEDSSYFFDLELTFAQWNEVTAPTTVGLPR